MSQIELENWLLVSLRQFLQIPTHYTREMIELNLPYLFAAADGLALGWAAYLEDCFTLTLPDEKVDLFFFSSLAQMVETIFLNSPTFYDLSSAQN